MLQLAYRAMLPKPLLGCMMWLKIPRLRLRIFGKKGVAPEVIEALKLLTHDESVPYLEYVRFLKPNPLARAVKLADLRHNSDLSRLPRITEKDQRRAEKYAKAIAVLEGEGPEGWIDGRGPEGAN